MSRYEVDKFDPPPDPDLICCICHSVLDTPRLSPCNHVFCKLCIETWLKRQDTCPTCRDMTLESDLRPVIPMVQNVLNRLNMICDYRSNGCDKKVMLEYYLNHIENCDYQMLKCRFAKCGQSFLRKECKTHEDDCKYREVKCNRDCGLMILFEDKSTHDCLTSLKKTIDEKNALIDTLNHKVEQLQSQSEDLNRQLCEMNENFANSWNSSSLDSWEIGTDITEFSMDDFSDSLSDNSLTDIGTGSETQSHHAGEGMSQRNQPLVEEVGSPANQPLSDHEGMGNERRNSLLDALLNGELNDPNRNRRTSSSTDGDAGVLHDNQTNAEGQTVGNDIQAERMARNHNYNLRLHRQVVLRQNTEPMRRSFEEVRSDPLVPNTLHRNSVLPPDNSQTRAAATVTWIQEHVPLANSTLNSDLLENDNSRASPSRNESIIPNTSYISDDSSNGRPAETTLHTINQHRISNLAKAIELISRFSREVNTTNGENNIANNVDTAIIEPIANNVDNSDIANNTLNESASESLKSENFVDHSENQISRPSLAWTSSPCRSSTLSSKTASRTSISESDTINVSSSDSQSDDMSSDFHSSTLNTSTKLTSEGEGTSSLSHLDASFRSRDSESLKNSCHASNTLNCRTYSDAGVNSSSQTPTLSDMSSDSNCAFSVSSNSRSVRGSQGQNDISNSTNSSHSKTNLKGSDLTNMNMEHSDQSMNCTSTYYNGSGFAKSPSKSDTETDDSEPDSVLFLSGGNSSQSENTVKGSPQSYKSSSPSITDIPSEYLSDSESVGNYESDDSARLSRGGSFSQSEASYEIMNGRDTPSCQSYCDTSGNGCSTEYIDRGITSIDVSRFKHLESGEPKQKKRKIGERASLTSCGKDTVAKIDQDDDSSAALTSRSFFSGNGISRLDVNRCRNGLHENDSGKTSLGSNSTSNKQARIELPSFSKRTVSPKVTHVKRTQRPPGNNIAPPRGNSKCNVLGTRRQSRSLSVACMNSKGNSMNQQYMEINPINSPDSISAQSHASGIKNVGILSSLNNDNSHAGFERHVNLNVEKDHIPLQHDIKNVDCEVNHRGIQGHDSSKVDCHELLMPSPVGLKTPDFNRLLSNPIACTSIVTPTKSSAVPSNMSVNINKPSIAGQKRPSQVVTDIPNKQPCIGIPLFPHLPAQPQQTLKVKIDLSLVTYPPPPIVSISPMISQCSSSNLIQTTATSTSGIHSGNVQNIALPTLDVRGYNTTQSGTQTVLQGQPVPATCYVYSPRDLVTDGQHLHTFNTGNGSASDNVNNNTTHWLMGVHSLWQQRKKPNTGTRVMTVPEAVQNAPKISNSRENKVKSSHVNELNCSRKNTSKRENSGRPPSSTVVADRNEDGIKRHTNNLGTVIGGSSAIQNSRNYSENNYTELVRSSGSVGNCNTLRKNILSSVGGRFDLFASESDDSDASWSPDGILEETDESFTEESESDSSYEVQVPKTVLQLLDEYVSDESDHSWTVDG